MDIRLDISADAWDKASQEMAAALRPRLGLQPLVGTCQELWVYGPVATIWFDVGRGPIGYSGSVLYLCCHLATWLREQPPTFVVPSESVFQSRELLMTRTEESMELQFGRVNGYERITASVEDVREAVRAFVATVTEDASSRLDGVLDPTQAFDWTVAT